MSLDFYLEELRPVDVFAASMTHNVSAMWRKAGCYDALYKSDGRVAGDSVEELERGFAAMIADPNGFKQLNPPNGWGDYNNALAYLAEVIAACRAHPKAIVGISA